MNKNLPLLALTVLLLSACASPLPSVVALPPAPKPQVPSELMVPLPEPLHFQQRFETLWTNLQTALDNWQKKQTNKPQ